jgi:hypothetical protein
MRALTALNGAQIKTFEDRRPPFEKPSRALPDPNHPRRDFTGEQYQISLRAALINSATSVRSRMYGRRRRAGRRHDLTAAVGPRAIAARNG